MATKVKREVTLPSVEHIRPNFVHVYGDVDLWFSYRTLIAFQKVGEPPVVSENCWGPTTGKHLNIIGKKDYRLPRAQFEAAYKAAVE